MQSPSSYKINSAQVEVKSPSAFLRQLYLERKQKNSAYSSRAFARDLGISQTLLSLIFNGHRPVTVKQATQMSILLGMSRDDSERFVHSTLLHLPENAQENSKAAKTLRKKVEATSVAVDLSLEHFRVISQWYHLPILDLCATPDFQSDPKWIAKRLNISPVEARDAIERLRQVGMLTLKKGRYQKAESHIYFPTQTSDRAVRSFHQQMMEKAKAQLDHTSEEAFQARSISSTTFAIDPKKMKEAKARIESFQKEMTEFLCRSPNCTEVYQMNVQLFPITVSTPRSKS